MQISPQTFQIASGTLSNNPLKAKSISDEYLIIGQNELNIAYSDDNSRLNLSFYESTMYLESNTYTAEGILNNSGAGNLEKSILQAPEIASGDVNSANSATLVSSSPETAEQIYYELVREWVAHLLEEISRNLQGDSENSGATSQNEAAGVQNI